MIRDGSLRGKKECDARNWFTHVHTGTHTYMHVYTGNTYAQTHRHRDTCTHTCVRAHAFTDTCTHVFTQRGGMVSLLTMNYTNYFQLGLETQLEGRCICCSCRGPGLGSLHHSGGSQLPSSSPRRCHCSGLIGHQHSCAHAHSSVQKHTILK